MTRISVEATGGVLAALLLLTSCGSDQPPQQAVDQVAGADAPVPASVETDAEDAVAQDEPVPADADGAAVATEVLADLGFDGHESGVGVVFEPRAQQARQVSQGQAGLPIFLVVSSVPEHERDDYVDHLEASFDEVERRGWPGQLAVAINDRSPSYVQYLLVAPDGRTLNLSAEQPETIQQLPGAVRRIAAQWARG